MNAVDILLVEDEAILAMDLADTLTEQGYRVVGTANDGPSAIEIFRQNPVDLLLCDINLPGPMNGLDVVRHIKQIKPLPVIYLTAYTDSHTFNLAKETSPAAYLIKPYQLTSLRHAIDLAFYQYKSQNYNRITTPPVDENSILNRDTILRIDDFIFIKQEYVFVKLSVKEVLFIEADGNYISIQTTTRKYLLRMSLSAFLTKVSFPRFVRVNRTFAVNLLQVDSFGESEIQIHKHTITLSRQYRQSFLESFVIKFD